MNDLDLVREIRADVPPPNRARLAPGRDRLLAAVAQPARSRFRWQVLLPAGVTTVAAATAVVVAVVTSGGGSARQAPIADGSALVGPIASADPRFALAADVLSHASVSAAARHTPEPKAHQWFYSSYITVGYGQQTQRDENWITFDGSQSAYMVDGHLTVHTGPTITPTASTALERYDNNATPMTAYEALVSLPSGPKALLAAIDKRVAADGQDPGSIMAFGGGISGSGRVSPTKAQEEFGYLAELLWNASTGLPPAAEAVVYKAMATLPGVTGERAITDAAGRRAVGLSPDGGFHEILLNPTTYEIVGYREISAGDSHAVPSPGVGAAPSALPSGVTNSGSAAPPFKFSGLPKGVLVMSDAWVKVAAVSAPGRR
jgi:hypothetical protein